MKRGIRFLLITDAWATLAIGMIGPIYAIFVEEIGGDLLDASWAYVAFMLTSGVMMYIISHWEDKIKQKEKLMTLGYLLTATGCLSYVFVYNQFTLIITQIILGLAEAILVPAYDSLYSNYLDKKHAAAEWGDWEAMRYIVTSLSALIGGYIAYNLGFKTLFIVMFSISIIAVLFSLNLFRKKKLLRKKT